MFKKFSILFIVTLLLSACATLPKSPPTREFECSWPGFTVTYPANWAVKPFQPEKGQVFRVAAPDGEASLTVSVSPHRGMPLKYYSRALLTALSGLGRDFDIIKDQSATLKDGTPAWETRLSWVLNSGIPLTSLLLTAVKEDMWITTAVSTRQGEMPEELDAVAFSLAITPGKEEIVAVPADIRKFLDDYSAAIANHDLDRVMAHFSDQYLNHGVKKSDIKSFFGRIIDRIPSHEIIITSFQDNGDTAQVAGYAVIAGGKFAEPGYHLKKNEAGEWRIYGNQQM